MSLAPPTLGQLATFTGRASSTFSDFAYEALTQATLLLTIATGLDDYPEDVNLAQLATYGILDMADSIYLSQPHKESTMSPFQSETIGSYSYSKMTRSVKKGTDTGVTWFDMAVGKLKVSGSGIVDSGSIEGMEWDGVVVMPSGKAKIVGASGCYPTGRGSWEIDTWNAEHYNNPL